jgi:hypothetical protein
MKLPFLMDGNEKYNIVILMTKLCDYDPELHSAELYDNNIYNNKNKTIIIIFYIYIYFFYRGASRFYRGAAPPRYAPDV